MTVSRQEMRRERQRAQHRAEILEAGISLFARRGHFGTRLEDVGQLAGFSRATIYLHFPGGKDELYSEVLMQALRRRARFVRETLASRPEYEDHSWTSQAEVISVVWTGFRHFYEEQPDYVRVIGFLAFENMLQVLPGEARQVLADENTAMFEMIDEAMAACVGDSDALPRLHSAWTLWAFFLGTVQFAHSAHVTHHPEPGELLDSALAVLLRDGSAGAAADGPPTTRRRAVGGRGA